MTPDDADKSPFIAQSSSYGVLATFGHRSDWVPKSAHECTTCAGPPRRVENHDRIRAFEPKLERLVVVPVGDPRVACEQAALLVPPLVIRRLGPARLPVVVVEMDHRQAGTRRERPRERALARSGHPGDEDAVADAPGCFVHQLECPKVMTLNRADATTARALRLGRRSARLPGQDRAVRAQLRWTTGLGRGLLRPATVRAREWPASRSASVALSCWSCWSCGLGFSLTRYDPAESRHFKEGCGFGRP
jgi:hypothetical protein